MGGRRRQEHAPRQQSGGRRRNRHHSENGCGGNQTGDRGCQRGVAGMARQDRQRARHGAAQVVRPHDGEPGRSRGVDDDRAGQAAVRVERRNRVRRVVHRMVCGGRQAHLRRCHSAAPGRQAHRRHQAADRRVRGGDAVEFPERDDHAQGRPRSGGRLHHGDQAGDLYPVFGARPVRTRGTRGHPQGCD